MIKRFGQTIRLNPEGVLSYIEYHRAVWPEVLETIRRCHIRNYSIFIKDLTLFAYFEYVGNDFQGDMLKMADDPATQRWWDVVKPLMDPIETRSPGEFWAEMKEVFHID